MGIDTRLTRKDFLFSSLALTLASRASWSQTQSKEAAFTVDDIAAMERVIDFKLAPAQRKEALSSLLEFRAGYANFRKMNMANAVSPATIFVPLGKQPKPSKKTDVKVKLRNVTLPATDEDIAFLPVSELSELIRTRKLSPVRLTKIYLDRIEKYSPQLLNVISITRARALSAAATAEKEIGAGHYRGPLHGIPFGIKDLFAAKGYPTTWGGAPFKDQAFDHDATVVRLLEKAGAILVAKTSVGALAMDDVWFGGKTKNPWNTKQGSSGSSAGSSSGMAAGLFAFAIGTETLGSIMSPSHRCRVTGLRPTFGRVSRAGAMALSWTMDKAGPICRTAEDCAIVLAAIHGADPLDTASVDRPLRFRSEIDLKKIKIGYLKDDKALDEDDASNGSSEILKLLKSMGVVATPVNISPVENGVDMVLSVEAAAAFDGLTNSPDIEKLTNSLWPAIFRANEFATGVGYVQALRARTLLMEKFERELGDYDIILASDRGGSLLFITNLTGHPQLYVPLGTDAKGNPIGLSLIGRLYDEGTILALAAMIQAKTQYWKLRPDLSKI